MTHNHRSSTSDSDGLVFVPGRVPGRAAEQHGSKRGPRPDEAPVQAPASVPRFGAYPDDRRRSGTPNITAYVAVRRSYSDAELAAALQRDGVDTSARKVQMIRWSLTQRGRKRARNRARPAPAELTSVTSTLASTSVSQSTYTADEMTTLVRRIAVQHGYDRVLAALNQWSRDITGAAPRSGKGDA